MRTDTGQVFRLEDYRPSDYRITHTDLLFRLDPHATLVTAKLTVERRDGVAANAPLVLDGDGLVLESLGLNGAPLAGEGYTATPDRLEIRAVPAEKFFELEIVTKVSPVTNKALMGLYQSKGNYCTQCEAEGFRRITYYLDRPDNLSTFQVRIEARKAEAPVLLSNGNPVEHGDLADGWHYAVWHDPFPKPSYLFALVGGDLGSIHDTFTTASGRKVALGIYVEHGKEPLATYAMDALKRSMRWDEERFSREYDLDVFNIVAVSDFNMGAMENKGLNIFNDKYVLADPETATDVDYAGIEAVIAHEYFHNWTGNRITCRDWFQLCLKEGLTVYRDHEFSADQRSRPVKRIAEVRNLRSLQFPEDQGPLAHPVRPRRYKEINNFYTSTVYEKGSEVVRMIHTILGPEKFRAGMDLYFERHDGQAVTIEDFLACFAEVSGRDLTQFALWYHQAGTPRVTVTTSHDPATGDFEVNISQTVPPTPSEAVKKPMHIPLAFGLLGPNGDEMEMGSVEGAEVNDGVIHLTAASQTIRFRGVGSRPVLSLNRGFSAPIVLNQDLTKEDRLFLARHDSDLFNRWEALNSLFVEALIAAAAREKEGKPHDFDAALVEAAIEIAGNDGLEPAYRALALSLPSEADVAREIGNDVDPDAVRAARDALRREIGGKGRDAFRRIYEQHADSGPFSPDAASAGKRSLRNVLLDYLAAAEAAPELAALQFETANNMTDRAAALTVLAHQFPEHEATRKALAAFDARYRDNGLVMDKWFVVQATIPGAATLERVKSLTAHPAFSLMNPNRVRSLVGAFSSGNQTGFHRADGAGYQFLADIILSLDRHNPQVAARLATAFRSWRSMEEVRQLEARKALERINAEASLSRDVKDIVERTLA